MAMKTPVSESRLRAIDDPTAAFPVGELRRIAEEVERAEEARATAQPAAAERPEAQPSPEVRPAVLIASLLAGAAFATAIIGLVAVVLLVG